MPRATLATLLALLFAPIARAEFPETVTIGDRTLECRTVEEIRKLGIDCDDIPWKDNAARVYIEAMNLLKPASPEQENTLNAGTKTFDFTKHSEDAAKWLDDNKPVLDLLRQADAMPQCELPIHRSKLLAGTLLPDLARYQSFGRLLARKAAWDFSRGRTKDAADECFLALRLGRRLQKGSMLIRLLVGAAVEGLGTKVMDGMIASGKLDEPALKEIAERLAATADPASLTRAFQWERAYGMQFVDMGSAAPPDELKDTLKVMDAEIDVEGIKWDVVRRNMKEAYDMLDGLARKPLGEALRGEGGARAFSAKIEKDWDRITRFLALDGDKVFIAFGRRQVTFDAMRIRTALERFKIARKEYPKALVDLVPAYLDAVPVDPFSGKPYGYRVEEDGHFVLWSVGDDLKDDGGVSAGGNPWAGPDHVFTSRPPEKK